jgi:hypothetical protein
LHARSAATRGSTTTRRQRNTPKTHNTHQSCRRSSENQNQPPDPLQGDNNNH